MGQLFAIAIRNLIQHRKRTLLIGGALSGVTMLLTLLICLSTGVHRTMMKSATTLTTGHINIAGFYKITAGQSAPVVTQYQAVEKIVRQTVPELKLLVSRGRGWAKMISETRSQQVAIGGLTIENEPDFRSTVQVLEGDISELSKPNTALIFAEQAKKLSLKVGDSVVLSSETGRGVSNTVDLRIAAIAEDIGILSAWSIFTSIDTVRKLTQINSDTTGALHLYLRDVQEIPLVLERLRKALAAAGYILMEREASPYWQKIQSVNREDWTGQKMDLTTWEEEMSFLKWTTSAIDGLMVILTSVLLIIISVGIMNSMWIAIRERTREIGTLRAIGMHRSSVLILFLIESMSLGLLGTLSGAFFGIVAAGLLNLSKVPVPGGAKMFLMSSTLHLSIDPINILFGVFIVTLSTTLVAIIPSLHAARLKPITAMQHTR